MRSVTRYKQTIHLFAVVFLVMYCAWANDTAFAGKKSVPLAKIALNKSGKQVPNVSVRNKSIPGQYIIVLKTGANPHAIAAIAQVTPKYVYDAALNGFAAQLNRGQLTALQHNPDVDYIEQDMEVSLVATQNIDSNGDPWGLDRIDQRNLPLSKTYTYNRNGAGVSAYIIDTGLQANHSQFGTRASNVYDAFGGNGSDCNGHGTHVGGTVAGSTYGVAKNAYLRGVRVLNCNGSGSYSGVIAGINWVTSNHTKPAVANLSLGGSYSSAVNTAVANMISAGVFTTVAAGNSNANACNYSPASASAAYTVAASTKTDAKASFSNYGSCVDGYAPGAAIKSAWINSGTSTISGTSMASPHVAGVGALYQSTFGTANAATITNWINSNATTNKITSNSSGTPNRLLYKGGL